MDIVERKDVKADEIDKVEIKDVDSVAGKYVSKNRRLVSKTFLKKATS
jgi:hypothetical protein